MKALIQRVTRGTVRVGGDVIGETGRGFVVLLGVRDGDAEADARALAAKTARLRIFPDAAGKMNLCLTDLGASALVISQFTLYADTRKGNRPSFIRAAAPALAEQLYERYVATLRALLTPAPVATGRFGASMEVEIINDGPVTVELSTD